MPLACPVEAHAGRYGGSQRETRRDKLVASLCGSPSVSLGRALLQIEFPESHRPGNYHAVIQDRQLQGAIEWVPR